MDAVNQVQPGSRGSSPGHPGSTGGGSSSGGGLGALAPPGLVGAPGMVVPKLGGAPEPLMSLGNCTLSLLD